MRYAAILMLSLLLTGCPGNVKPDPGNPVAVTVCPETLPALTDDTFGGTVDKLIEVIGIYFKCREAAVGGQQK